MSTIESLAQQSWQDCEGNGCSNRQGPHCMIKVLCSGNHLGRLPGESDVSAETWRISRSLPDKEGREGCNTQREHHA